MKCYSLNNEEKQSIFTRELIGDLIIMEKVSTLERFYCMNFSFEYIEYTYHFEYREHIDGYVCRVPIVRYHFHRFHCYNERNFDFDFSFLH